MAHVALPRAGRAENRLNQQGGRLRLACSVVVAVVLAGCGTLLAGESARPIDEGRAQVAAQGSVILTRARQGSKNQVLPVLAVRWAATDALELGARGGAVRPELTSKLQLRDAAPNEIALAWTATLGAWTYDSSGTTELHAYSQQGVLVGVPLGTVAELVLGPKLDLTTGWDLDGGTGGGLLTAALSVGCLLRLGTSLALLPEIAAGFPVLYAGTGGPLVGGGGVLQAGLSVLVGGENGL